MAFIQIGSNGNDLTFEIPTDGTTNWGQSLRTLFFNKMSIHNHDGAGGGAKIANGSIEDNAISAVKIQTDAVTTAKIQDNAVTTAKILNDAVTTAKILDANITTAKLASDAVTTVKILDSNVTTAKIADSNITTAKIADANVTTAKIADNNITTAKILDANVTTAKIADGAVTAAKLENAVSAIELSGSVVSSASSFNVDSVTITTTTTRPVLIFFSGLLDSDSSTTLNFSPYISTSATTTTGTEIGRYRLAGLSQVSSGIQVPLNGCIILTPSVGSNTFYLHIQQGTADELSVTARLTAIQL